MQFINGEGLDKVLDDLRRLRGGVAAAEKGVPSASVAAALLSAQFSPPSLPKTSELAPPTQPPPSSATLSGSDSGAEYCRSVARLGLQVAEGLAYAHKQGILHRDIKPSNLLLDLQGTVWITDFGLAKAEDADELTQTGDIVGTVRYMAPERFDGASLPQSDVYALGVTLYEMLTLQPAFGESNRARLMQCILHNEPPAPRALDPRIPRDLETVVLKAIARDPARRYTTAGELAEDLRRFLSDRPVRARRSRLPERLWRWCRRNPAIAALIGVIALFLLVVVGGSLLSAWSLRASEREARDKLWRSKLNEARATARSGLPGQRFTSLKRIREALAIAQELGLTEEDRLQLRNAAIAALVLPDFEAIEDGDGPRSEDIDFWPEHYAHLASDGHISVCRIRDGREIASLPAQDRHVSSCLSPDGRHLAVCPPSDRANGKLRLWRLDAPEPRCVHEGVSLNSPFVDFSPDSTRLAYESTNRLTIVELESGRSRSWPLPGTHWGGRLRCRPGSRDVSVGRTVNGKSVLEVRDLNTGMVRTKLHLDDACSSHDWHPTGRLLAAACYNPKPIISLWDVEAQRPIRTLEGHRYAGVEVRFNHTGDRLMSVDWSGSYRFWDTGNGRQVRGMFLPWAPVAYSPDERYVACSIPGGQQHYDLRIFRATYGREVRTLTRVSPTESNIYLRPSFSGDGRLLAAQTADSRPIRGRGLAILDWPSGRELGYLPSADQGPLGFDRDGALWTGFATASVFRWPRSTDPVTGTVRLGPPDLVLSIPGAEAKGLSPDGQNLALANYNQGAILLHGGPSGQLLPTGSQEDVRSVAVSPDGRWVAGGSHWCSSGLAAKVWDARTGRLVKEFAVPGACSVGFSPDGHWFVTDGGGIRLWRTGTWEEGPQVFTDGDKGGWTFAPDGRLGAVGGYGRVRLVRLDSGAEVARLALTEQTVYSPMSFAPGGELLIQGDDTEALHVWDIKSTRRQLADMGLDWSDPPPADAPIPAAPSPAEPLGPAPTSVEFVGADLATNLHRMRQYQVSLAALALRANPFDAEAHRCIARSLEDTDPAAAFARYTAALAFRPEQPLVAERRAVMALRLKRWPEIIADTCRILEQHPDRYFAQYYRARAYQSLGRHAEAVADFTMVLAQQPSEGQIYERRADSYEALGDKARAEADRRKAAEVAPEDAGQLNRRAWRLLTSSLAERDAEAALRFARKAAELAPEEGDVLNTLGVALYRNKLYNEAITALEKSLTLSNGRSDAYDLFFLAMCYQRIGKPSKARDCFDRALRWCQAKKDVNPYPVEELKAFEAEARTCLGLMP
jgi:WD40 repeat protein/tetratricopeptide (TPR) repeat protein